MPSRLVVHGITGLHAGALRFASRLTRAPASQAGSRATATALGIRLLEVAPSVRKKRSVQRLCLSNGPIETGVRGNSGASWTSGVDCACAHRLRGNQTGSDALLAFSAGRVIN